MFIGALLVCASMTDVETCDVKMNTKNLYETKQECVQEMQGIAKYVFNMLELNAKPYCFPLGQNHI